MYKKRRVLLSFFLGTLVITSVVLMAQVQLQKPPMKTLPVLTKIEPPKMIVSLGCGLNIPLRPQETAVWCWAASGEMVMENLQAGLNVQQCDEAEYAFHQSNCCTNPFPASCVYGGWDVFPDYGFAYDRIFDVNGLSWAEIQKQLCDHKPVMYAWAWDGGGGHMMVITGWSEILGVKYVHINDPWPPNIGDTYILTYDAWVNGAGYSHWADYYNIRKNLTFKAPKLAAARNFRMIPPNPPQDLSRRIDPTLNKAAVDLRRELDQIITPEMAPGFGFANKAEASQAVLGTPIMEYRIRLDDLKAYKPGQEARSLLRDQGRTLYPLLSGGKARSAVRVEMFKGQARVNRIGNTTLIRMIEQVSPSSALAKPAENKSLPVVEIPAMGLYFVVREDGRKIQLASLFDVDYLRLKKGVYEPAHEVLARIQPFSLKAGDAPM